MAAAIITASVGLVVAVLGYVFTYRNSRRLNERQDQLARINEQLAKLYGPLLTLGYASNSAWLTFATKYVDDRPAFFSGPDRTEEEIKTWVSWMQTVFMPINRRVYETIVVNGHLLVEEEVPDVLLRFCAHVSGYEPVVDAWSKGDYSRLTSLINHPGPEFYEHIRDRYAGLKRRQVELLAETG
jgi:hypothetical protein